MLLINFFLDLLIEIVVSLIVALSVPILIRFVIFKKPLPVFVAILICAIMYFVSFFVLFQIKNGGKPFIPILATAILGSYWILREGAKDEKIEKHQQNKE